MSGRRARGLAVVAALLLVVAGIGPAVVAGAESPTADRHAAGAQATLDSGGFAQADAEPCSFPVERTDATGETVTLSEEPDRVVALGANIAQIAWALGAEETIVGMPVNPTTAYLNGSSDRTSIYQADQFTVATEEVVALEPDVVLAPNIISNETVSQLRDAGLTVFRSPFGRSLTDVYGEINQTGEFLGACEAATDTVATVQDRVRAIEEAVADEERPRVLSGTGTVPGNGTFIHEIIETAGGDNLAANANISGYAQISNETVVARDPQWLVVTNPASVPTTGPLSNITAVRENQTIAVNTNYLSQPGPLVIGPMTQIARALHPAAIDAANLSNVSILTSGGATTNGTNATDTETEPNATDATTGAVVTTIEDGAATDVTVETGATTETVIQVNDTLQAAASNASQQRQAGNRTTETTAADDTTTATAAETTTASGSTATETTSGNGPGFGIVGAAIALLGAGLLASRRRL